MAGSVTFTESTVDDLGRKIFVLVDVLTPEAALEIHERLRSTPVSLTDADRPDTREYKHFKHDFMLPGEECTEPFANALIELARSFLAGQGIPTGRLHRVYLNVNLFGDFQFAHTDGDGWTALLFANARWDEDWGGAIILYRSEEH